MSRRIFCSMPIACPTPHVQHDATHVIRWRTDQMAAPAFWYVCEDAKDGLLGLMTHVEAVQDLEFPDVNVSGSVLAECSRLASKIKSGLAGTRRPAMQLESLQQYASLLDSTLLKIQER